MMERTKGTKTYIGVDNGVSGSIGVVSGNGTFSYMCGTPTFECLNYQKEVKYLRRLHALEFEEIVLRFPFPLVILERPLVNPGMFSATLSAVRCLEATLTILDRNRIPKMYCDSRDWQGEMLPGGLKGPEAWKRASAEVGKRLFPRLSEAIDRQGDADGLLIAEWSRRNRK